MVSIFKNYELNKILRTSAFQDKTNEFSREMTTALSADMMTTEAFEELSNELAQLLSNVQTFSNDLDMLVLNFDNLMNKKNLNTSELRELNSKQIAAFIEKNNFNEQKPTRNNSVISMIGGNVNW